MPYRVEDVLRSVQESAPPPHTTADDIISSAQRLRRRRTTGSAVTFLAVVAAAVTLLSGTPGAQVSPAAIPSMAASPAPLGPNLAVPSGPLPIYGEYITKDHRIGPTSQLAAGYQEVPVYRTDASDQVTDGIITVYRPGVYDPANFGQSDATLTYSAPFPVDVGLRPGTGRDLTYRWPGDTGPLITRTALAWQYAPDAWATFSPERRPSTLTRNDAVRIAMLLDQAPPGKRPARAPYRIGFLPANWQVAAVTETPEARSDLVSEVFLVNGPQPGISLSTPINMGLPVLRIATLKGEPDDPALRGRNGTHCYDTQSTCVLVHGGYHLEITDLTGALSTPDFRRIANALTPSDIANPTTWPPVT
ncbi:hypothetical protein [Actinoplanes sp. GCM10030250]|uniref:hypothetical protein n=1 Tax=Actinoplanes sp. GCM10030250 TaxID=3273376 RepID=UPI003616285F